MLIARAWTGNGTAGQHDYYNRVFENDTPSETSGQDVVVLEKGITEDMKERARRFRIDSKM